MLSPRLAPPMIGMGLLELIEERDILAGVDPDDRDGDGITGRANRIWSREFLRPMLGRFGWKAGQPTVAQQVVEAFAGDMGLSTPLFRDPWGLHGGPGALPRGAARCPWRGRRRGGAEDVRPRRLLFPPSRGAGPPRCRRPEVLAGKRQFHAAGCAACHRPSFVTGSHLDRPELSGQRIWPYTDLLLHDMGEGLADGRPEVWPTAASGARRRSGASG